MNETGKEIDGDPSIEVNERAGRTHGSDSRAEARHRWELLPETELDATLQFGSREMSLKEFLALGPGDVVELDRHVSEPVDLVVGDRVVARGEVVVVSGNFAFLVNEVMSRQMPAVSL